MVKYEVDIPYYISVFTYYHTHTTYMDLYSFKVSCIFISVLWYIDVHCTLYTVQCTVYNVQFTVYIVHTLFALY